MTDTLAVDAEDIERILAAGVKPRVALVLGSGLGLLADRMVMAGRIPFAELTSHPRPAAGVAGHAGELVTGTLAGVPVAAFLGRVHRYQGLSALDAAWPARLAAALGCETLIVTNAAGGIDPVLRPGSVTLISDHINLSGDNPLVGWAGPPGGTPFVAMGDAYDPGLRAIAREEAQHIGLELVEVVYAGLLGPSYETPAEVEYLRRTGAQTVGMSTVHEVIAARALGLRVLGLSLVTNVAGGAELSHDEVLQAGRDAAEAMSTLVEAVLGRLDPPGSSPA